MNKVQRELVVKLIRQAAEDSLEENALRLSHKEERELVSFKATVRKTTELFCNVIEDCWENDINIMLGMLWVLNSAGNLTREFSRVNHDGGQCEECLKRLTLSFARSVFMNTGIDTCFDTSNDEENKETIH